MIQISLECPSQEEEDLMAVLVDMQITIRAMEEAIK